MAKMVVPETEDATLTDNPHGIPARPARSPTRRCRVPRWGRLSQSRKGVRAGIHSPATLAPATPATGAGTGSRCGGTGDRGAGQGRSAGPRAAAGGRGGGAPPDQHLRRRRPRGRGGAAGRGDRRRSADRLHLADRPAQHHPRGRRRPGRPGGPDLPEAARLRLRPGRLRHRCRLVRRSRPARSGREADPQRVRRLHRLRPSGRGALGQDGRRGHLRPRRVRQPRLLRHPPRRPRPDRPKRRGSVARLGVRAVLAGTLANLLNAAVAGMFV
jgi:hypothetical protein